MFLDLLFLYLLFMLPTPESAFPDRLTARLSEWRAVTDDKTVLSIVARGLRVLIHTPPRYRRRCVIYRGPPAAMRSLGSQIDEWARSRVIERVPGSTPHLFSLLFPVPKPPNKLRWCLDLRETNKLTSAPRLRLPGVQAARLLLPVGCWFCRIDLTSAYSHVLMRPSARRLLAFWARGQRWRFRALPFGLSTAPAFFTRLLRPVAAHLTSLGVRLLRYLDDLLIWATTADECRRSTRRVLRLFERLGFVINYEKSALLPSQRVEYLGFEWLSASATIHPLPRQLRALRRQARDVLRLNLAGALTVRRLAALVGKIVSQLPAMHAANFRRHALQRCVNFSQRITSSWDASVQLSVTALRDCRWLASTAPLLAARLGRPWRAGRARVTLTTDASPTGWGAWISSAGTVATARADWCPTWTSTASSNLRETAAVTAAFFSFLDRIPWGARLLIRSDNTTAVAAVRRMGARSRPIGQAIEPLIRTVLRRQIQVSVEHIPGVHNSLADRLSRFTLHRNDWGLTPAALAALYWRWPETAELTIDLFASRSFHLLDRYATIEFDPRASAIDAFTLDWSTESPLIVPPINLIPAVCGNLLDHAPPLCVLVTPLWRSASWWGTVSSMATSAVQLPPHFIRAPPHGAPFLLRGPPPVMVAWLLR